jgi:predicted ATP-grasp superfamily ATP-dependent carboligase
VPLPKACHPSDCYHHIVQTGFADSNLLIFGASARAAAFSALRARFRPGCADLFADADLAARCPVVAIAPDQYPDGFLAVARTAPAVPWIYTGGLENRPGLVRRLARTRPLWGNGPDVLARCRDPHFVFSLLQRADLLCPRVLRSGDKLPPHGQWLIKPLRGAGGVGIRVWSEEAAEKSLTRSAGHPVAVSPGHYFQEFIDGEPFSAVFVGEPENAELLGVSRQLVGVPWLHAAPFQYCGSVAVPPEPALVRELQRLGGVLAAGCGLRGLFGVDFILRDGRCWPVEINPRYTASVEVIEHALGIAALAYHQRAFDASAPAPPAHPPARGVIGKAYLFAARDLVFPAEGPWLEAIRNPTAGLPAFADVPPAGQAIPAGRPVFAFFAETESVPSCLARLQAEAERLTALLW